MSLKFDESWTYEAAGPFTDLKFENDTFEWENPPKARATSLIKHWANNLLNEYPDSKLNHYDVVTTAKRNIQNTFLQVASLSLFGMRSNSIPTRRTNADTIANALKVLGVKAVTECVPSRVRDPEVIQQWLAYVAKEQAEIDAWVARQTHKFSQENINYLSILGGLNKEDAFSMLEQATLKSEPISPEILEQAKFDWEFKKLTTTKPVPAPAPL